MKKEIQLVIGQKVYALDDMYGKMFEYEIDEIVINKRGVRFHGTSYIHASNCVKEKVGDVRFAEEEIGKKVFLSKNKEIRYED